MGQSSSRHREPTRTPAPLTDSQMLTDSAGPSSEPSRGNSQIRHISESSESRRSSSLLNLGNIRRRVNSAMSSPGDSRPSWRHSKSQSKAPALPTPFHEEPLPSSSTSLPVAGPSIVNKGKEPERNLALEDDDDDEYHEAMEDQPISQSGASLAADMASPSMPEAVEPVDHTRISDPLPTNSQEQTTPVSNALPDNSTRPSTPRSPALPLPRQFPPPGTLVIVQGVVHTTDISRSNPQPELGSNPEARDDSSHTRTRDRLSSLLRPSRPSTSIQPDPHSLIGISSEMEAPGSIASGSAPSTNQSARTTSTTPIIGESVRSTPESHPTSPTQPETAPENQIPSISSSSIDVLGTLLRSFVYIFGSVSTDFLIQRCSCSNGRFSAYRFI